jgi:urease accessory protein
MTTDNKENVRRSTMKRTPIIAMAIMAMLAASSTIASAHVGVGHTTGFAHGFWHPLSGLDHILAMVLVGLYAAQLGGRAIWLVPASFVCLMAFGGALGVAGVPVPFTELGIGLSVVVFGGVVAFGLRLAPALAMALVGFFAIFHGHAHGTEMPETAAGLAYGLGFVAATVLLHTTGVAAGLTLGQRTTARARVLVRWLGGAASLAGVALLTGVL